MPLKSFLDRVMAFSRAAADFQAQLVLMMVYFTVVAPFGLIARLQARTRPQPSPGSHWTSREEPASSLDSVRRQF